ncbi:TYR [Branchiostoma lanceolatum]|uniref:Tyrosinase n=1 Tax=Branchiostoma lanceolatum TaxID=7740 RepID=A0A8K0F103_BRALA|nr:TYR [Branchiostoma lanceolatum]
MATVKRLVLVAVCFSLLLIADAQFPRACTDAVSFGRRECCPIPAGFTEPCGGAGRGQCGNFTDPTPTNQTGWPSAYNTDDRRRWPSVFFTRFCSCEGNYAWADCSRCKLGFYGPNCTETKVLTRKNVLNLTAEEKAKFVAYVNNTKYAQIDYVVASESYVNTSVVPQFRNVSAYDYFAYLQYYASSYSGLDFSHRSAGFATWNRAMLLLFERAVQEVNEDDNFALPYYDWTESPSCNSSNACSNDLVGAINARGALDDISVFSRWETVCVRPNTTEAEPCDVNVKTGPIIRKAGGSLPTEEEVNFALRFTTFDKAGYNTTSDCSFRNLLEGQVNTGTGIYDPTNVSVEDALPASGAAPGHNREENIVPFFPPFPHASPYKRSTELGYDYADINNNGMSGSNIGPDDCPVPPTTPPATTTMRAVTTAPGRGVTPGLIVGFCVAAALGIAALGLLAYCAVSNRNKPAS